MTKKALYIEIPPKVIADSKRLANALEIPMNRLVELALREFIDHDPQFKLVFNNDDTRKPRKLK